MPNRCRQLCVTSITGPLQYWALKSKRGQGLGDIRGRGLHLIQAPHACPCEPLGSSWVALKFTDRCVPPACRPHSVPASPKEMVRCTASQGIGVAVSSSLDDPTPPQPTPRERAGGCGDGETCKNRAPAFEELTVPSDILEGAWAPEAGEASGSMSHRPHDHRQDPVLSRSLRDA